MANRTPKRPGGWLDRHPGFVSILAAAGLFGLIQGSFLLSRALGFPGGWPMIWGMLKLGLLSGMLTWLLLIPLVLLARRLHPAWRRGERLRASWSVCLAMAAALAAWMGAEWLASGLRLPEASQPWIAIIVALAAGLAASFVRLPERFLRIAAGLTVLLTVLAVLPLGPGFPTGEPPSVEPAVVAAPDDAPDVVLVSIDTLRADRLGAYGRSPSITPELDRLAAEGVVFSRTLASSPWTVPSVASMLTGLSSLRHGAGLPLSSGLTYRRSPLENRFTTLAEHFTAAGYRTRAAVSNPFLASEMGMAQGFQQYESPFSAAMGAIFMRELPLGRLVLSLFPVEGWADFRAEGITERALEWLSEPEPAPLFLWVHYIDPHSPYQADPRSLDLSAMRDEVRNLPPPVLGDGTVVGESFAATSFVRSGVLWLSPQDRERIQEYYDLEVRYLDEQLGRLFTALRTREGRRPAVLAFTADHGEEFWDHGHFEHGHDYYREVTEIPLIFWSPGSIPAGLRVDTPVGLVDVAPTLLELAALQAAPLEGLAEGRSLRTLWTDDAQAAGEQPPRFSGNNLYGLPAVLVEAGPWRYILRANGAEELYDVIQDPGERHNRAAEQVEIAGLFRQMLEPRLALFLRNAAQPESGISEETLRALRSLGYVR